MKQNTILLNWDGDAEWFFMESLDGNYENLEEKAKDFLEKYYKDSGIGDILFNIFDQNSVTPSKVFTDRASKYYQKLENGIAVDYSGESRLKCHKISREDYGVGITEVWVEHCKALGIRPWLSVRMNDNHYANAETGWIRSDFFYEAKKNGWMLGERYNSSSVNWNYAIPEVQKKMLDYIEEQLLAIDVFGIELDFMREPMCLDYYGDKNVCLYMNGFIEKVRATVDRCAERQGHPIKIAVRLPRDINLAKRIGFDAEYWAKNSLVDAVVPSSHWLGADTGMPIAEWCEKLSPYGVEIYPCLEMNLPLGLHIDAETAKAHTVQYADQGGDATYIYNLYHVHFEYLKEAGIWFDCPSAEEIMDTWRSCGDIDNCRKGVRRHLVTEESLGFHKLVPRWNPLPKKISFGLGVEVQTGNISDDSDVTLFVGIKGQKNDNVRAFFNANECKYLGKGLDAFALKNPNVDPEEIFAFSVPEACAEPLTQVVAISGDRDAEVYYLELKVDAK